MGGPKFSLVSCQQFLSVEDRFTFHYVTVSAQIRLAQLSPCHIELTGWKNANVLGRENHGFFQFPDGMRVALLLLKEESASPVSTAKESFFLNFPVQSERTGRDA
jgi:hypothetical protein